MCKFKALLSTPLFLGVTLMAFYACSSEELDSTSLSNGAEVTTRPVVQIEDVCKLSKSEFEFVNPNMNNCLSFDSEANRLSEDESKQLENALSLYSRTDIETVLDNYGVDKKIYEACKFYEENLGKKDVFSLLSEKYSDFTYDDWKMTFDMYYCGMLINSNIIKTRAMSASCAISVGGAVISCMSAVAIGNLAGLGWWLASYSASLAGVVASCS